MKFEKIVGFGDSWIWGDELLDPALANHPQAHPVLQENTDYRQTNCFLGQLGKHYDVTTENFGIPGGSLHSTVWTFLWWLQHEPKPKDCLVVVGLTDSYRFSHYNPEHVVADNDPPWYRFVHSAWAHNSVYDDQFGNLIRLQTALTMSPESAQLAYAQTVLFFDGVAARQNLNLLQVNVAPPDIDLPNTPTLIPDLCLMSWFKTLDQAHKCPHGHPNESGHRLIAQRLISTVDSCIIKG